MSLEEAKIDVNVFKDNKKQTCIDCNNCAYLKRLITALSYYNIVSINEVQQFIDFCDKYYSKEYLEDYIHFICIHNHDLNTLKAKYKTCCNINNCLYTKRHYRDRARNDSKQGDAASQNTYIETFDTIHFYIYHMEECGLRVSIDKINHDDYQPVTIDNDDADSYLRYHDEHFAAIIQEVESKKKKCGLFKRLDGTRNSKFNIMNKYESTANQHAKTDEKQREETISDGMLDHIVSVGIEQTAVHCLKEYLSIEEYDTDCIQYDINIWDNDRDSNLSKISNNYSQCMENLKLFIKTVNVSSSEFSTGFVFWYWKYYETIDDNKVKQKQKFLSDQNDFGGYSVRELFVKKYFNSLKQEILQCKIITITQFNEKVIEKGNRYLETEKCRNMKCIIGDTDEMYYDEDPLHFGIKFDENLKKSHLYALILYCDFTDFCTAFSSTFRKIKWNEVINSVRERNRKYFHTSKNLREVIQYYGIRRYEQDGPFYSGLTFVMNIPQFCIRLNGPTSTSMRKEVAIRFSSRDGMLIQLNNQDKPGYAEVFFDTSFLSAFPEEDERVFCGGRYALELDMVLIMKTQNNYHVFFSAFYKFDKILSGPVGSRVLDITQRDYEIVTWFMKYSLGEAINDKFDEFIKNTFYLFTQRKTQIILCLHEMDEYIENKDFIGLIMHSIEETDETPNDNLNLFKSCLFSIFTNLQEIILYSDYCGLVYSCNILQLLSIMHQVPLPKSFKTVTIKYRHSIGWLKSVLSPQVKQMFASKCLNIELKTEQGSDEDEDWIIIST